ncbi:MAG: hypothetical protein QNJ31_06005 [Candidatus Caenarcaniphilales bacterium]|nr:hypothetical protein [Candidatus Caenarcaniphilales bacterium]
MSSNICDSCHAGCCRAYRLIITVYDFIDLVNAIGLNEAVKGVCFEPIPFNLNYTSNKNIMFPFIFDNQDKKGKMFSLALKRVESKLFPGTVKCFFLGEEERAEVNPELPNHKYHPGSRVLGRCSVYMDRPTMCRTYPIAHNPNSKISVLKKRENLPQSNEKEAYQICPKQTLELEDFDLTDSKSVTKKYNDLLLNEGRTQAHNEVALKWNSQPERLIEKVIPFISTMVNSSIVKFQGPQNKTSTPPIISTNTPQNALNALSEATIRNPMKSN